MKNIIRVIVFIFCLFLSIQSLQAQVNDNFNDGNFTSNPTWIGTAGDWQVNSDLQLQSNNTVLNSTYYITTANTLATQTQWEMYVKIDFNPSSANYIDAYLTASASDISNNNTTGYFVRIGNTQDDICLYRKDINGVAVKIIDGVDGILNNSTNVMKIKVIRSTGNQWTLFRDLTGAGTSYVSEGVATDATYTTSSFFGFLVKQSTASFFQKHYFDDIVVAPYVPDVTPPAIQSINALSPTNIDVLFTEPVDQATAETTTNYSVNNNTGSPAQAVRDASNLALVHLTFARNFANGVNSTLTINGVKDLAGNAINNGTGTFSFYVPQRYDVVIDEILADPTPVISLPNAEYVELKNTSTQSINLQGWKIASLTTTSSPFPSFVLPPDSYVILTSTTNAPLFASYGKVLGVTSFPALIDGGTTLTLTSKENITVHSVSYTTDWYQNAVKSDGGWSLEMIDPTNPCSGYSNWKASIAPLGGTPGTTNSVNASNKDQIPPALLRAAATDNVTVILSFDEPLDSTKAATAANYSISDGIGVPASAITLSPTFDKVQLKINTPLVSGKVYTITASGVTDCSGNIVQAANTTKVGLPSLIDSLGVVINEILFNPKSGGVDYVELYNRSNNAYNLKDLYIATHSTLNNTPTSKAQISTDNRLMFPGDFYVISNDVSIVEQQYTAKNTNNFINVNLPTFADDQGIVELLNAQGIVVDELHYDAKWHFPLINNQEGVSLERVDYNKPTQSKDNWHSAASTVGYGTPGYQNSQFRSDLQLQGEVTVSPKVFSPDNDGTDDFAIVNYQMSDPGYVANITIFDASGRPVKYLAKNATLAPTGSFRWDGLDEKLHKVPVGTYIIYSDVFNLNGNRKTFKNTVVVAAKF